MGDSSTKGRVGDKNTTYSAAVVGVGGAAVNAVEVEGAVLGEHGRPRDATVGGLSRQNHAVNQDTTSNESNSPMTS